MIEFLTSLEILANIQPLHVQTVRNSVLKSVLTQTREKQREEDILLFHSFSITFHWYSRFSRASGDPDSYQHQNTLRDLIKIHKPPQHSARAETQQSFVYVSFWKEIHKSN